MKHGKTCTKVKCLANNDISQKREYLLLYNRARERKVKRMARKFKPNKGRLAGFLIILGFTAMDLIEGYRQEDKMEELESRIQELENPKQLEEES